MGSCTLALIMIVGAVCVAQALKCNYCQQIDPVIPYCPESNITVKECTSGFNTCLKITMTSPAYGEVRRCGTSSECDGDLPPQVQRYCCQTDICN
ncbi:lymphocyte antigen 6D-like [Pseudorasbora parva]|uniref:lymphocyte antigen 6D-like n=1 Tax=Pseudorasbora parva TaxID=51549 RepID=UPI00351E17C3